MSLLTRIQSKSREVKMRYAFAASGILTGLIAIVWVSTISARFEAPREPVLTNGAKSGVFDNLFAETKSQLGALITGNAEVLSDVVEEIPEDPAPVQPEAATPSEPTALEQIAIPQREAADASTMATDTPERSEGKVILIATTSREKSE